MVSVLVIRPFKRRGSMIPPGTVLHDVPTEVLPQLMGLVEVLDPHRLIGEALAEVDRLGWPWPLRFLADLPAEDRQRLRGLEQEIDAATVTSDAGKLAGLLNECRILLLRHLN